MNPRLTASSSTPLGPDIWIKLLRNALIDTNHKEAQTLWEEFPGYHDYFKPEGIVVNEKTYQLKFEEIALCFLLSVNAYCKEIADFIHAPPNNDTLDIYIAGLNQSKRDTIIENIIITSLLTSPFLFNNEPPVAEHKDSTHFLLTCLREVKKSSNELRQSGEDILEKRIKKSLRKQKKTSESLTEEKNKPEHQKRSYTYASEFAKKRPRQGGKFLDLNKTTTKTKFHQYRYFDAKTGKWEFVPEGLVIRWKREANQMNCTVKLNNNVIQIYPVRSAGRPVTIKKANVNPPPPKKPRKTKQSSNPTEPQLDQEQAFDSPPFPQAPSSPCFDDPNLLGREWFDPCLPIEKEDEFFDTLPEEFRFPDSDKDSLSVFGFFPKSPTPQESVDEDAWFQQIQPSIWPKTNAPR